VARMREPRLRRTQKIVRNSDEERHYWTKTKSLIASRGQVLESRAGSTGRCNTTGLRLISPLLGNWLFGFRWRIYSAYGALSGNQVL
jgi:hypothetical protein